METPKLLWIDLAQQQSQPDLFPKLADRFPTRRVADAAAVFQAIREAAPSVLCFDFDYPDQRGLKMLQQTKLRHPVLPILMLTEYHSEPLAVWAFRTRVWDYLVKPVEVDEVTRRIVLLSELLEQRTNGRGRANPLPLQPIPVELRCAVPPIQERVLLPALSYVEAHYPEKIGLGAAASLCGLGPFQFSRLFRRLKGMTFQEFLLQHRIGKALKLLRNPRASVTDIAFAVGFNDLSHFARMFRRYVGLCPSKYRRNGNGNENSSR